MKTFVVVDQGKLRRAENIQFGKDMMGLAVLFLVIALFIISCFFTLGMTVNGPHVPNVTQADREFCAGPNLNETFCHDKGLR